MPEPFSRAAHRRTDAAWIAQRLADPASRALLLAPDAVSQPVALPAEPIEPVLLGTDATGAVFALEADPGDPALGPLRDALATAAAPVAAYGAALMNWHRRHRFCANCGHATQMAAAGHERSCPGCGAIHHPRLDPVVIMLVIDGDRVLLGRGHGWDPGLYSCLAGFVEPGETLEQAVAREVLEETQVTVTDVRYRSSQSWPFPASLMMGFEATYSGGAASKQDLELDDCRWLTRAEIEQSRRGDGPITLPTESTIARRLLEGWLAR